jgi:hypothetical protein
MICWAAKNTCWDYSHYIIILEENFRINWTLIQLDTHPTLLDEVGVSEPRKLSKPSEKCHK